MAWYLVTEGMTNKKRSVEPEPVIEPGEQHAGHTAEQGASHDKEGAQVENEPHVQPNADIPNTGSARTTKRPRIKPGDVPRKVRY